MTKRSRPRSRRARRRRARGSGAVGGACITVLKFFFNGDTVLTNPKVPFLDEPTRGIDVGAKAEIQLLIKELAEQGKYAAQPDWYSSSSNSFGPAV